MTSGIQPGVHHFAKRIGVEHNLKPRQFDASAMEALQRHHWCGNIRELRNTVERLMIMTTGATVRLEDLPPDVRNETSEGADPVAAGVPANNAQVGAAARIGRARLAPASTLREFKDTAEGAYLVQKLRESNWNISKTAEVIDTP